MDNKEKIFFTADTHFGSQRTLELSRRPFDSVEDMDMALVGRWNNVVGKNDTVYHIGDFGNYDMLKFLNGNIILLLGNYERDEIEKGITSMEDLKELFTDVIEKPEEILLNDAKYMMVHEPSHYVGDIFKLYGHIHKAQLVKRNGLNVGTDVHDYAPVSVDTIEFYKTAVTKFYDEEVFGF